MASLANVQDAINQERSQPQPERRDEEPVAASGRPPITTTSNAPELDRTASVSAHPPGAWVDDGQHRDADGAGDLSIAALGESIVGALGSAAKYLPAGVVNTFAGYAPGVAGPSKSATGSTTDVSKAGTIDATPTAGGPVASKDQFVFRSSQEDLAAGVAAGMNLSKDSAWKAPTPAASKDSLPPMSINRDSGSEVPSRASSVVPASDAAGLATAAQFVNPDVLTPLSPASVPSVTNVGGGRPTATVSTTAVTGHSSTRSGIEAPPPSAATLLSPQSQGGPLSSKLPSTLNVPPPKDNDVPSSVVSVKSGVVGAGPTDELAPASASASTSTSTSTTNPYANKSLPPTPAGGMVQDGVTPRESELGDDLQYLAPHIRQQNSTAGVPSAQSNESGSVGASRFDEGELESAHPTPASEVSSHSRESSVSEGGTRRVSIVKRIRGEAKIIAGKIKKDESKVAEGKAMLHGEV